jgi:Putative zinc-finger
MTGKSAIESLEHQEISALIPWYVNASIGDSHRQRVEAHLRCCTECRCELQMQRRVYEVMAVDTGVEYIPTASLKRLQSRLDALDSSATNVQSPTESQPAIDATMDLGPYTPTRARPARRSIPWTGLMAASLVVTAVAAGVLAASLWTRSQVRVQPANYYTVTNPVQRAPSEVIRAVFAPTTTVAELQSVLDESQMRIIAGPTEAGVYSLAASSDRAVSSSLEILRRHSSVRFAEITQPITASDAAP